MTGHTAALRRRLHSSHGDVLSEVDASADAVVRAWSGDAVDDRSRVVGPFRSELVTRGAMDDLPAVLRDLVDALGHELSAPVVPAPPYVVVTSTGVVLRATLPAGRLVIALEPFTVERDPMPTYRRRTDLAIDVRVI